MRSELTTIITGTYNKHEFLPDAAESVLKQTNPNWRWWIILDDADDMTKDVAYKFAKLDNRITCFEEKMNNTNRDPYVFNREAKIRDTYFPRVGTKWLCWLSDDDLLEPYYIEVLTDKLIKSNVDIAFGFLDVIIREGGEWKLKERHCPSADIGLGTPHTPFCNIDGGQFIQTKISYEKLKGWTFFGKEPSYIDGFYMVELTKHYTFHRVPIKIGTKRMTYLSTYQKSER